MPPRKTPAKGKAPATKPAASRRSKLAKENDITAEEEASIKDAWNLFRVDDVDNYEDEKEGVVRTSNIRDVLQAQGLAPKAEADMREFIETLDPESEGYVTYPHLLALCAIQLKSKTDETKAEEIEAAFSLFHPRQDTNTGERLITMQDLRAVAKALKEDVSDEVLKAMILEANGGKGMSHGVNMEEFQEVLTRARVFQ